MWHEEYENGGETEGLQKEVRGRGSAKAALRRNKAGDMHTNCASKQTSTRRRPRPPQGRASVGAATAV